AGSNAAISSATSPCSCRSRSSTEPSYTNTCSHARRFPTADAGGRWTTSPWMDAAVRRRRAAFPGVVHRDQQPRSGRGTDRRQDHRATTGAPARSPRSCERAIAASASSRTTPVAM
ncbi:MAG: hypothetical protein AVDCRST_MAG50-697, partial [uncultured Acidimicrobiales bacterium]